KNLDTGHHAERDDVPPGFRLAHARQRRFDHVMRKIVFCIRHNANLIPPNLLLYTAKAILLFPVKGQQRKCEQTSMSWDDKPGGKRRNPWEKPGNEDTASHGWGQG